MTRRQRRAFINHVRHLRNAYGDLAAVRYIQNSRAGLTYWNYETDRLTGVMLTDTRGRGIVIDL